MEQLPSYVRELITKIANENAFTNYSVNVSSGSEPGDGFASELFRITICEHKSDKKLNLVCKIAPENKKYREEFFSNTTFQNEADFYTKHMPKLAKFQKDRNLSEHNQFQGYPKCYGTIIDEENDRYAIVLEDLRPFGFKMWDKSKPVPVANARLTMRELGKFHGLSLAMKDQCPDEFAEMKQIQNIFREAFQSEKLVGMFEKDLNRTVELLKKEEHKTILNHVKNNLIRYSESCFDEKASDRFGVYCHGDCWNNNILYRFNEQGIAEDIRILDWQVVRYSSPATDLIYNIFTSTDKAFRDKEFNNLIDLYYKSLSETVKLLGSNPEKLFTLDNLKDELKRCGNFALIIAPTVLHVSQGDPNDVANKNEMIESDDGFQLVTGLSDERQKEFGRRVNEMMEDIVQLGFYHKVE